MTLLEGSANLRGKVAYVPQQAWMQNATLKDNVLFGRKYKKDLYQRVRNSKTDPTDQSVPSPFVIHCQLSP